MDLGKACPVLRCAGCGGSPPRHRFLTRLGRLERFRVTSMCAICKSHDLEDNHASFCSAQTNTFPLARIFSDGLAVSRGAGRLLFGRNPIARKFELLVLGAVGGHGFPGMRRCRYFIRRPPVWGGRNGPKWPW